MRRRNFTLVELLTVIAIIGILAGITIPTVSVIRRKAREAEAKTAAVNIANAVKAYRQQYNRFPGSASVVNGNTSSEDYELFMAVLTGDIDSSKLSTDKKKEAKKLNPRRIKFLEQRSEGKDSWSANAWLDPYDRPFVIFIDDNYDGKVKITDVTTLNGDVYVLSVGLDGKFDSTKSVDDGDNKDNINSWK